MPPLDMTPVSPVTVTLEICTTTLRFKFPIQPRTLGKGRGRSLEHWTI